MGHKTNIVIACDHAGFSLKQFLLTSLQEGGYEVEDLGCGDVSSADYGDYADRLAARIIEGNAVGILLCGSGIGMSISVNRYKEVRGALCYNIEMAQMARLHNDANVVILGSRYLTDDLAFAITMEFLITDFSGSARHVRRIAKIS